jgi:nucleotide-binding universal stress UspA family protein
MGVRIKKILVPLDLSETSLNAFRTAAFLATKWDATIVIINVIEDIFNINGRKQLHAAHYATPDVLNALIGTLKKSNINSTLIQKEGSVVEAIISSSVEEKTDLVVIGTHGASGIRENFIGSNAYSVIKYSNCPVLTLPSKVKASAFRKILYPILPVRDAFINYEFACNFFHTNSTVEVLGLSSLIMQRETNILDDLVKKIKPQLEANKVTVETAWANGGTAADEILLHAKVILPDLIVLSSMIDTIYKRDFIGPYSQKIINCSRVPLLAMK